MHSLLYVLERGGERQYFYLARVHSWSADPGDRSGPEFADPARGEYRLQAIHLTAEALTAIDHKPGELAAFLLGHLRVGVALFDGPDPADRLGFSVLSQSLETVMWAWT